MKKERRRNKKVAQKKHSRSNKEGFKMKQRRSEERAEKPCAFTSLAMKQNQDHKLGMIRAIEITKGSASLLKPSKVSPYEIVLTSKIEIQ